MRKRVLKLFIFFLFLVISLRAQQLSDQEIFPKTTGSYNLFDEVIRSGKVMLISYDDWGFKGSMSLYGLPSSSFEIKYNGLKQTDPLYGTMPFSWFNPRYSYIEYDEDRFIFNLRPIITEDDRLKSRFDYYRGDWSFLNFGLFISGAISENAFWRFTGENLAYDGAYGLYGPDLYRYSESISQSYNFDVKTALQKYVLNVGVSYQKLMIGIPGVSTIGFQDQKEYLSWYFAGKNKDYRTSSYIEIESTNQEDSLSAGIQYSGTIYRNSNTNKAFSFSGESTQLSAFINKEINFGDYKLLFTSEPLIQTVYSRSGGVYRQTLINSWVESNLSLKDLELRLRAGIANGKVSGYARLFMMLSGKLKINVSTTRDYALYPSVYSVMQGGTGSNFPDEPGFSYSLSSAGLNINGRFIESETSVNAVNSNFLVPFKMGNIDTLANYERESINEIYLTENFKLTLPWKMVFQSWIIFSPTVDISKFFNYQTFGSVIQEIDLFKGNLHLYLAGEVLYTSGGERLGWFEELRQAGYLNNDYFTNERLSFNAKIGARIDSFHIFYAFYNAEGRQFSTLPLIPYRNRLKIFGIEWSFLD